MAFLARQVQIPARLPAGYTRLDYIQSSGTQYIDTGFKPNQNTRVIVDVDLSATSGIRVIFGGRDGDNASDNSFVFWQFSATTFRSDFDVHDLTINVASTAGRFLIDKNKAVTTINGTSYTNNAAIFQPRYNMGLFSLIDPGGADNRMVVAKMYSCKIYDNGTIVRDFVPCKNANNVYGLYDLVNREFYTNAGSGSFTGG